MQIQVRHLKVMFMYFSKRLTYLDGVNFRLKAGEICVTYGAKQINANFTLILH
jgi:ABC-type glutathione transport system ATPase component